MEGEIKTRNGRKRTKKGNKKVEKEFEQCTVVRNSHESGRQYWATCSSVHPFARLLATLADKMSQNDLVLSRRLTRKGRIKERERKETGKRKERERKEKAVVSRKVSKKRTAKNRKKEEICGRKN